MFKRLGQELSRTSMAHWIIRLDEVFQIADRVAVLRDGQMVGMRDIEHTNAEDLVSLIVGRKAREIDRPDAQDGPKLLTVTGLATRKAGPVDFGKTAGTSGTRAFSSALNKSFFSPIQPRRLPAGRPARHHCHRARIRGVAAARSLGLAIIPFIPAAV